MGGQPMFVDPRDLLGDERGVTLVVVDAGDPEQHERNVAVKLPQNRLSPDLGLGVGPGGLKGRVLVDQLVVPVGRPVDQHAAGVDELLDLEGLQALDQAARAQDVDGLVERVRLAGNVIVGGEVHDRLDLRSVADADLLQRPCHAFVRAEVEVDRFGRLRRLGRTRAVQGDDAVLGAEPLNDGAPDEAGRACDQDDTAVGHPRSPSHLSYAGGGPFPPSRRVRFQSAAVTAI